MPYITQEERKNINAGDIARNAGQLNYMITTIVLTYLSTKGLSYQTMNDIVGALEGAKAEFQRRVVNPYEDSKIEQNGDVFDCVCHETSSHNCPVHQNGGR